MLVGLLLLMASVSAAEVYKWKDADGKTHISDQPPPDQQVERVQIRKFTPAADSSPDQDVVSTPSVVMLSATWCGVCKRARNWLAQNGVPFTEYDVERDQKGIEEYRRLGARGVPIILVGEQRMDGFSAKRLEAMLVKAKK